MNSAPPPPHTHTHTHTFILTNVLRVFFLFPLFPLQTTAPVRARVLYNRLVSFFPTSGRYWRLYIEQEVTPMSISGSLHDLCPLFLPSLIVPLLISCQLVSVAMTISEKERKILENGWSLIEGVGNSVVTDFQWWNHFTKKTTVKTGRWGIMLCMQGFSPQWLLVIGTSHTKLLLHTNWIALQQRQTLRHTTGQN